MTDHQRIIELSISPEYKELIKLGQALEKDQRQFDLLTVFDDLLDENAWSRLFAYLFDSKNVHGLKQKVLRAWLQQSIREEDALKNFLKKCPKESSSESRSQTEWRTQKGRRIDILVKFVDHNGRLKAVIGIENKVGSGEQAKQLADYQESLEESFPGVPKLMFFLTPDGRKPVTAKTSKTCPCISFSYKSILGACDKLRPKAEGQGSIFLAVLASHINKITKYHPMEKNISLLINKLRKNPGHRRAMKLIGQYSPNIKSVFEGVVNHLEGPISKTGINCRTGSFEMDTFRSKEIKLEIGNLRNRAKKIEFVYMLHFNGDIPDIGDEFTLRIMLWFHNYQPSLSKESEKFNRMKNKVLNLTDMPNDIGSKKDWRPWINIWVGDSYTLVDLGKKDIQGLSTLLTNGINQTFGDLKRQVKKLKKTRLP